MSLRARALILAIVFFAVAGIWFFTPVSKHIYAVFGLAPRRGFEEVGGASLYDVVTLSLNALNALFAGLGVFYTAKSLRSNNAGETGHGAGRQ